MVCPDDMLIAFSIVGSALPPFDVVGWKFRRVSNPFDKSLFDASLKPWFIQPNATMQTNVCQMYRLKMKHAKISYSNSTSFCVVILGGVTKWRMLLSLDLIYTVFRDNITYFSPLPNFVLFFVDYTIFTKFDFSYKGNIRSLWLWKSLIKLIKTHKPNKSEKSPKTSLSRFFYFPPCR